MREEILKISEINRKIIGEFLAYLDNMCYICTVTNKNKLYEKDKTI